MVEINLDNELSDDMKRRIDRLGSLTPTLSGLIAGSVGLCSSFIIYNLADMKSSPFDYLYSLVTIPTGFLIGAMPGFIYGLPLADKIVERLARNNPERAESIKRHYNRTS